jgi:hypothetical protein
MSKEDIAVITSLSSEAIRTYCETVLRALGPTVVGYAYWSTPGVEPDPQRPFVLTIVLAKPFRGQMPLRYTREDVYGYNKNTTTAKIQHDIHRELEHYRREHLAP